MLTGLLSNSTTPSLKFDARPDVSPSTAYLHARARVVKKVSGHQRGRIRLHDVYWFAKLYNPGEKPVEPGDTVIVVGREDNTLIVVAKP